MPARDEPKADAMNSQSDTPIAPATLTHLQRLEAESIHIMREVVANAENPVMLYSVGKDSACTLHLARKHGGDLAPRDAAEEALMLQWSFYAATAIEPDALTIMMLHTGREQSGEDATLIADAAERLVRPMKVLEDHLATHGHLVGGRFTVADLNVAEIVRYAEGYGELMGQFPAVQAWLTACHDRPAFQKMWEVRRSWITLI